MAQIVQSQCPGCKTSLRIPAEWTGQPMRCKHCGATLQAKAAPAAAISPSRPTPPPPPRKGSSPPPPPAPTADRVRSTPPPAPAAAPVPPAAAPLARPVAAEGPARAFDFTDEPAEAPSRSTRKRRRNQGGVGGWIMLGVLGLLLVGGGIAVAVFLPQIKKFASDFGKAPTPQDGPRTAKDGGKAKGKDKGKAVAGGTFPRRALVIDVHNYLYCNPITVGSASDLGADVPAFMNTLSNKLNVPMNQIFRLSDAHPKEPRPPLRSAIQQMITNFLATTRKQDRILVFFIGHTREIDGKAYLVPLEGELDNAETLLPLAWVYEQLGKCEARQKVFVLDGNRHNLAQGEERPIPGPMTEAFAKALAEAPKGVQVWAACSKDQESNEREGAPLGMFLHNLQQMLASEGGKSPLEGRIQSPDEPIPLDELHKGLNERLAVEAEANKLKQTAQLIGKEPDSGAEYDPTEAVAKAPALPTVETANVKAVRELLDEISVPSLKGGQGTGADLTFGNLPPFPPDVMKKYEGTLPAESPLRQAIQNARMTLWAVSTASPPPELTAAVTAVQGKLRLNPGVLLNAQSINKPAAGQEQNFKNGFENQSKDVAKLIFLMEQAIEELEEAGKEHRDAAPPRWQAHYDYMLARFRSQMAYLEEYNNLLGGLRKDLPPVEGMNAGWKMAAKEKPGDSVGKKHEKEARKKYAAMIESHQKTPWEVLGKREKLNALGLEWQQF